MHVKSCLKDFEEKNSSRDYCFRLFEFSRLFFHFTMKLGLERKTVLVKAANLVKEPQRALGRTKSRGLPYKWE